MMPTITYTTFRELRSAHGLTQRAVAEHVGITTQTISNLERGAISSPALTARQFARLCELFEISITELADLLEPEIK